MVKKQRPLEDPTLSPIRETPILSRTRPKSRVPQNPNSSIHLPKLVIPGIDEPHPLPAAVTVTLIQVFEGPHHRPKVLDRAPRHLRSLPSRLR